MFQELLADYVDRGLDALPPARTMFLAGGAIATTYAIAKSVWNLYLSPLARQRIPGPTLAALSNAWIEWHGLRQDKYLAVHAMFEVRPHCPQRAHRVLITPSRRCSYFTRTHTYTYTYS
jgi:hypothetical protein